MLDRETRKMLDRMQGQIDELNHRAANMPVRWTTSSLPSTVMRGKLNASLARGSQASPTSVTFSRWAPSGSSVTSAWTDTNEDFTVIENGLIPTDLSPIASGTWVQVILVEGRWVLDDADLVCP